MTADQCKPLNPGGQNTVRIVMNVEECKLLCDAIQHVIGRTATPDEVKYLVGICQTWERICR